MSAQGIAKLISIIRQAPIESGMSIPEILLVAPPKMVSPKGPIADKFEGAQHKCIGLAEAIKKVAEDQEVFFFDSSDVTEASRIDGIHLDEDQYQVVGQALSEVVTCIIELQETAQETE